MNNTDIDALSGRELDVAVAVELGWRWMVLTHNPADPYISLIAPNSFHTFASPYGHFATDAELASNLEKSYGSCPYYSTNIAVAWELDGKWWEWRFTQIYSEGIAAIGAWVMLPESHHWIASVVKAPDFSTKTEAYATVRCRAWLKAKYTEKGAL